MASAKKSSSSKGRSSTKRAVKNGRKTAPEVSSFAICVNNEGYEASLELRKLYPVLEDDFGSEHNMIRIIDESGEDYLFPSEYFVRVTLPQAVEKQLKKIA